MRNVAAIIIPFCITIFAFFVTQYEGMHDAPVEEEAAVEEKSDPPPPPEPPPPNEKWVDYEIKKGDTLGKILSSFNISTSKVQKATDPIYNLTAIRFGKTLSFLQKEGEKTPLAIRYPLGEDKTLVVSRSGNEWTAKKEEIQYTEKMSTRKFTVSSSFWVAATDAGLRARDIVGIANVLEYDVDFNTEMRKGAHAKLIVPELFRDGKFVKLGAPKALEFTNNNSTYVAIQYKSSNGSVEYYDEKGLSRRGAFLRSPLPFSTVTSSFNPKRFHPILKTRRPHNGTDFGAPTGTKIRTVADGVVVYTGKKGGHGNFIKIKHQPPYKTSYSHLSKIMVRKGQRVKQGQIIGKVGMTGLATGPHLHFQMWKNNKYVDAMRERFSKTIKLPVKERKKFNKERDRLMAELKKI